MKKVLLEVSPVFNTANNGEAIFKIVMDVLEGYNLTDKIIACTYKIRI